MFLFSFSKKQRYDVSIHDHYTILFYWRQKILASFVSNLYWKPECRDLLVDHYSDLIPIIRMPERIFDFPFQRVYTYVNLN